MMRAAILFFSSAVMLAVALVALDVGKILEVDDRHFEIATYLFGIGAVFVALSLSAKLPSLPSTAAILMIGVLSVALFFSTNLTMDREEGISQTESDDAPEDIEDAMNRCLAEAKELDDQVFGADEGWNGTSWQGAITPEANIENGIVECLKWVVDRAGYYSIDATVGEFSTLDPVIALLVPGEDGYPPRQIDMDDDGGPGVSSRITSELGPGEYIILLGLISDPANDQISLRIRNQTPGLRNSPVPELSIAENFAASEPIIARIGGEHSSFAWFRLPALSSLPEGNSSQACIGVEVMPMEGDSVVDPVLEIFEIASQDDESGAISIGREIAYSDDAPFRGYGSYVNFSASDLTSEKLIRIRLLSNARDGETVELRVFYSAEDETNNCTDPRDTT